MKLAGTLFACQARSPRAQRPVRSAAASALLAVTLVVTSALFATLFAMPQPARVAVPVSFKVTGGQEDVDYRLTAYNELYIMTTTLTISTTEPIGADHIVVDTGTMDDPARLTFDGVTIISGDCPINILEGHALELTLAPGSVNSLTMNGSYPRQAIALGAGSSLTVKSDAANPGSLSVVSAARAGAPVIGGSGRAISLEGGLMSISAANSANPLPQTDEDGGSSAVSITGGAFAASAVNPESPDTIYGIAPAEGFVVAPNPNPASSTDYPVLVGSEDLYKPSTLQLVQDAVTTYDGSAVTSDEVLAQASQDAQDVTG